MKSFFRAISTIALTFTCSLTAPSSLHAAAVVKADFTKMEAGTKPGADIGKINFWTGAAGGDNGKFALVAAPGNRTALAFIGKETRYPVMDVRTPDFTTNAKTGAATFSVLIPTEGKFQAAFQFGDYWQKSAATVVLTNGDVSLFVGGKNRSYSKYTPNSWEELRVEFDFTNKTYSVYWNKTKIAADLPWNDPNCPLAKIMIEADRSKQDHGTDPMFLVGSCEVTKD